GSRGRARSCAASRASRTGCTCAWRRSGSRSPGSPDAPHRAASGLRSSTRADPLRFDPAVADMGRRHPRGARMIKELGALGTGLSVTLENLFKKPFTVKYPEEKLEMFPRFRGLHIL